jgi:hypothetical protein
MKVIGDAPVKRRLEFEGNEDEPTGKMSAMQVISTKGTFCLD